ncbi:MULTISPECIES: sigma 54-interacting transcriptional regulator [Clostridium]|uniref:sigma 54-interacting transcriptional regulator n=1 Tax=Clostridium TaxID=1485 RepID=UPI00215310D5|nr:sigma-54-dependent transcriptional regulator [Clostridium sp. LY3-2]MCR6516108.1 sigma 54-interacting transcriptional regulator [Clostridium sp. LY3-2]
MGKVDKIYETLEILTKDNREGITTYEISEYLNLDRANISRYLNILHKEKKILKREGRPVRYYLEKSNEKISEKEIETKLKDNILNNSLDNLVGASHSLSIPIQQAKAAMLYPPRGLHTILLGETGVGKSMFAELMYKFSKDLGLLKEDSKFIRFNCADYADNPQLVMAQIFGVKRGAYTGADKDRDGLLKKADSGVLFLDEIHRLSPQGQEMLFTFIDKGIFRPLGDTGNPVRADVQLIVATTENPESYLLKTFTRRIPMTITLPPLKDRNITERYYLLENFIKEESGRLKENIYFNRNALISFLLYECPYNIGQLKSDIQLACAKAFLKYKSNENKFIIIDGSDLNKRINNGILKFQKYRDEIESLLKNMGETLIFSYSDEPIIKEIDNKKSSKYFYDIIEEKIKALKSEGMSEKDISKIINIDIDRYFNKYINELSEDIKLEEIIKIVDKEVLIVVKNILDKASKRLDRLYEDNVYYGLALHMQGSIERIKSGQKIYNPKLNNIRVRYMEEFLVSMELTEEIESKFKIHIPLDEIGYLTMFLSAKSESEIKWREEKVSVLVVMHGNSTATSMVEVSNKFLGEKFVYALDMPLTMKAEEMYLVVLNKIKEIDRGKGVLLLVDMGSLTNFSTMIMEEIDVPIKTVDMVSTLVVIEAGRRAIKGRSLDEVYSSSIEATKVNYLNNNLIKGKRENIVITTCFTGEGSAVKLKEIILKKLSIKNIRIKPLDILDREEFLRKLERLKNDYNVLAIVGTLNMNVIDIPFIEAKEILKGSGILLLSDYIDKEEEFIKITDSLSIGLKKLDGKVLVKYIRRAILEIQERLNIKVSHEVSIGIIMHLSFLIEKILSKEDRKKFKGLNEFRDNHSKEFILLRQSFRNIEINYDIKMDDDDLAYIATMFLKNAISV